MTEKTIPEIKELSFIEKVATIQNALKVPKSKNEKVPYKSRNAEEILDKVKPLLAEHGLVVLLDPALQALEGRLFIVSTATVTDGTEAVTGKGIAELLTPAVNSYGKATMNESQASGAAGSYANKYALGAVFGIGEAEDADHEKYQMTQNQSFHTGYLDDAAKELTGAITDKQISLIELKRNQLKTSDPEGYTMFGEWYKTEYENKPFKNLTKQQASVIIDKLKGE